MSSGRTNLFVFQIVGKPKSQNLSNELKEARYNNISEQETVQP